MKNTLETRLGLFFALALIALIFIIEMVGGLEFFKRGYLVQTRFSNALELKAGDPVKMAGVQIGRVEMIDFDNNKVVVTMKINRRAAQVKTDSTATIKFQGLMGQNYVAISFGSTNAPLAGETGLTELTGVDQPDLSALLSKLDNAASGVEDMTKKMGGDNFGSLLGPFTDFLKENKDKLSGIFGNIQTVSSNIAKGNGTVGKLINEDALYNSALSTVTNFNGASADIKETVQSAKRVIAQIEEGKGTIGKLTKDETLYREATNAMINIREVTEKVNRGQGSVGKLVNDESLYKNAKVTLQKLDKATEGLEDQGPLSVLGIAAGKLF
jgi:phospholipid/cholesterol/gamma-HCH transport system substrate-binding protein